MLLFSHCWNYLNIWTPDLKSWPLQWWKSNCLYICYEHNKKHQTAFSIFLPSQRQIEIVHKNQAPMLMGPAQGRSFFSSVLRRRRTETKDWCVVFSDLTGPQSACRAAVTSGSLGPLGTGLQCLFDSWWPVANCGSSACPLQHGDVRERCSINAVRCVWDWCFDLRRVV